MRRIAQASNTKLISLPKRNFFDARDVLTKAAIGGSQFVIDSQNVMKDLFSSDDPDEPKSNPIHEILRQNHAARTSYLEVASSLTNVQLSTKLIANQQDHLNDIKRRMPLERARPSLLTAVGPCLMQKAAMTARALGKEKIFV